MKAKLLFQYCITIFYISKDHGCSQDSSLVETLEVKHCHQILSTLSSL